jgi:ferredoxin
MERFSQAEEGSMRVAHASNLEASAAEQPAPADTLHVVVDLNRCQGYAQCCFFAPSVFQLHGEEALWYDLGPDQAQREHVLRAMEACPVQAIAVEWTGAAKSRSTEVPNV